MHPAFKDKETFRGRRLTKIIKIMMSVSVFAKTTEVNCTTVGTT